MKVQITPWHVMVGAYLVGFGMLTGLAIDHMLFDRQRSAVLRQYDHALKQWHSQHMLIEKAAQHSTERPEP